MNAPLPFESLASAAVLAAPEPAIRVESLSKRFPGAVAPVLDDVSLEIAPGEVYGVIGRSGAGKSMLVRCINRLERPSAGRVFVSRRELTRLEGRELRAERRRIGMIFQHFNLLSSRDVAGNVALALEGGRAPKTEIAPRKLVRRSPRLLPRPIQRSGNPSGS